MCLVDNLCWVLTTTMNNENRYWKLELCLGQKNYSFDPHSTIWQESSTLLTQSHKPHFHYIHSLYNSRACCRLSWMILFLLLIPHLLLVSLFESSYSLSWKLACRIYVVGFASLYWSVISLVNKCVLWRFIVCEVIQNQKEFILIFFFFTCRYKYMGQIWASCPQAGDWPFQLTRCCETNHFNHHWTRCWGWGHYCWILDLQCP